MMGVRIKLLLLYWLDEEGKNKQNVPIPPNILGTP
jgi:hypothetical protein